MSAQIPPISTENALSASTALLNSGLLQWAVGQIVNWWRTARYDGPHRALEYHTELELTDEKGQIAVYRKRQVIQYLHNGITAIQDQAWGKGQIFVNYRCSPGYAVDRYPEGYRYRILISLRETKNRGEVQEFNIERTIRNGFVVDVGNFQTHIEQPTRNLATSLVFPKERLPKRVVVIEQNTRRTAVLDHDHMLTLPDGRVKYTYTQPRPRLFESYTMQWAW